VNLLYVRFQIVGIDFTGMDNKRGTRPVTRQCSGSIDKPCKGLTNSLDMVIGHLANAYIMKNEKFAIPDAALKEVFSQKRIIAHKYSLPVILNYPAGERNPS